MAGVYCIQGAKCVKCNSPHLISYHHHFTWYCKANNKTNPPRLETKKGKSCSYLFRCLNYKGNHQANSNECLFWRHQFNKEWYAKKYTKLRKTRRNSTCSTVNTIEIWFWRTWKFFCKMFERIISSSVRYLKSIMTSILSLFKNYTGQLLGPFLILITMKALPW